MANYPKFELVDNEKNYLNHVWSTKLWDVSQMPSKLYLHTGGGVLVAIKPKFFTEIMANTEHVYGTHCIFGFEMAGKGLQALRVNTYNGPSILFASPADFEYHQTTGMGAYQIPVCSLSDILRDAGYTWGRFGMKLWYNNNGLPSCRELDFNYRAWIDLDGYHAEHLQDPSLRFGTLYKNREDCVADLPEAQVVDFDEPEPEPEGIMDDSNGHESELVRRINDAWVRCKEKFEPILKALYERDIDEITDADSFRIPEWEAWPEYHHGCNTNDWGPYNKLALEAMKEKWDEYAENYLQHIADNNDLSTILHFLNYANR